VSDRVPGPVPDAWLALEAREVACELWCRENEDELGTSISYASHEAFRAGWDCAAVHLAASFGPVPATATQQADALGRLVRQVWDATVRDLVADPKPSWLTPWEDLDEFQREVDRRIGMALAVHAAATERAAIVRKLRDQAAECRDISIRAASVEGSNEALAAAIALDHAADLLQNAEVQEPHDA
jgi:hypothetical protein